MLLDIPFDSNEARQLNRDIFETMYFAALTESNLLAQEKGYYPSYLGSQFSQGIYQFDYWDVKPSNRWDWVDLEEKRIRYGFRNSMLLAVMPTKSTAHLFGYNEGIGKTFFYILFIIFEIRTISQSYVKM